MKSQAILIKVLRKKVAYPNMFQSTLENFNFTSVMFIRIFNRCDSNQIHSDWIPKRRLRHYYEMLLRTSTLNQNLSRCHIESAKSKPTYTGLVCPPAHVPVAVPQLNPNVSELPPTQTL